MSKFDQVVINGGNNQLGNHNKQTNITNNNHHHNNGGKPGGDDNAVPGVLAVTAAIAALIAEYFMHIDEVYLVLLALSASSFVSSSLAWITLSLKQERRGIDSLRWSGSAVLALLQIAFCVVARNHAPAEIVELSRQVRVMEFWHDLTNVGRNIAVFNFTAFISLGLSAVAIFFAAFRQLAYAAASSSGTGFWYRLYRFTSPFKMRNMMVIALFFCGFAWAALAGWIPPLFH